MTDSFSFWMFKGNGKVTKEARKERNKLSKLRKFDPQQSESTREEKIRLEQEIFAHSSDDEQMDDVEFDDDADDEDNHTDNIEKTNVSESENKQDSKQSRIEELRAKLRAKLEERKQSTPMSEKNDSMISKRAARRADKKKKIDLAKRKAVVTNTVEDNAKVKNSSHNKNNPKESTYLVKEKSSMNHASLADDLNGIDFGAIVGLKSDFLTKGNYLSANKSLKNMGKKKSLERLLSEAEAKKERLRQLKESADVEDKEKAKQLEWTEALRLANGENMRVADPALLKKALKRKAKKKAKSQESWKSRMEQVNDKMDERNKIKNFNKKQRAIGGAAGANLSKKRIKDTEGDGEVDGSDKKKKARLGPYAKGRAGFEGKKNDFINKGTTATSKNEKTNKTQ